MSNRHVYQYSITAGVIVGIGILCWVLLFSPPPGSHPIAPGDLNDTPAASETQPPAGATSTDPVSPAAEFDGKVIYATDMNADEDTFRTDCEARGGTFDSCGSPCAPDAEICATVCAFTCTLSDTTDQ